MWSKVAEQMASPWRVGEVMNQAIREDEVVRLAAISTTSEDDRSRKTTTNLVPQANQLPELRMPIIRDTVQLPSFREIFSDVPSTCSAP